MNTGSDSIRNLFFSSTRAGEADHDRPEEAGGGDGVGAAESCGPAESRAGHAQPVQAPAGDRGEIDVRTLGSAVRKVNSACTSEAGAEHAACAELLASHFGSVEDQQNRCYRLCHVTICIPLQAFKVVGVEQ